MESIILIVEMDALMYTSVKTSQCIFVCKCASIKLINQNFTKIE